VTAVRPDFVAPSPTCGSTLTGTTEELTWSANGNAKAQEFRVRAGFSVGGVDFGDSGWTTGTSTELTNIPGDGSFVFVRFQWRKGEGTASFFRDCKMVAPTFAPPALVAPGPVCGGTIDVGSPTFHWDPGPWQIEKWGLQVGSTPGGSDYFNDSDLGASTSATVTTPIQTDGRLVYVRLRYYPNKIKRSITHDCVLTAGTPQRPILTGPTCGSSLPGSHTEFSWDPRDVTVERWQLLAGSTLGGKEYFESAVLDGTEDDLIATGIPRDGRALFVRLRWRAGGVWKASDCSYTAYKATSLRSEGSAQRTSSLTCTRSAYMPIASTLGCVSTPRICEPPDPAPVPPVPGNLSFPTLSVSTRGSPDGDPNAFGGSWSLSGNFVSECNGKLKNESLNTGNFAVQQDESGNLSGKITTIVVPNLLGCSYNCASPGNCTLSCPDAQNLKCAVTCTPQTNYCDRDSTVSGSVAGDGSISMSLTHDQVLDYDCGKFGKVHIEDSQGQADDPATPAIEPALPGLELDFPAPERIVN